MVNPIIHELLQQPLNDLISLGSGMASAAGTTKAERHSASKWWAALEQYNRATDHLIRLRSEESKS